MDHSGQEIGQHYGRGQLAENYEGFEKSVHRGFIGGSIAEDTPSITACAFSGYSIKFRLRIDFMNRPDFLG